MRQITRTTLSFLLVAPLLLGAIGSAKKADKKDVAPGRTVEVTTPVVPYQPSAVEQPATAVILTEDETPTTPVPSESAALYEIDWYSINGGGTTNASSTNYQMGASIGQSVAGSASSPSYQMGIGFWYGAGGSGCTCACWADPTCDAVRSNIQDVVVTVNVAFRGAAGTIDPGCTVERSDVDANGSTSVTDVVKVINVAFRGQTIAANYVDPCL